MRPGSSPTTEMSEHGSTPSVRDPKPLVTVIIASYNLQYYIAQTLESVTSQTHDRLECIVVDDGSHDRSPDIADSLALRDTRIRVVRQENQGTCNARNRGLQLASAESRYILFLDSDDLLLPNFLEVLVGHLEANSGVALVYTESVIIDQSGAPTPTLQAQYSAKRFRPWDPLLRPVPTDEPTTEMETLLAYMTARPTSTLYRASVLRNVGGWDQGSFPWEDNDLIGRILPTHRVHYLPLLLSEYRVHEFNASKVRLNTESYQHFRRKLWHLDTVTTAQRNRLRRSMMFERYVEVFLCLRSLVTELRLGRFAAGRHHLQKAVRATVAFTGMSVTYLSERIFGRPVPVWRLFSQLDFCRP